MKAYGITHPGAVRKENQDFLRYEVPPGRELLTAVLCDGMGGARAGSVASSLAADAFMSHAANSLDESTTVSDARAILREAVNFANGKVYDRAFEDYDCMGMGSTMVALLAVGRQACIANVGDSRAYLLYRNGLRRVTRDHSLVEEMVAKGHLTPAEALNHPKRNIITRAIGVEASVKAELFDVRFLEGTRLLLCSDGLTNTVSDLEIQRVLNEIEDPEAACQTLLDLSLRNGAPDNVTVFLAQH